MKKKILVIDDDPKIVQVLQIRLQSAGYEVLTARDGVYGLRLATEGKPDLVLLDIMMPIGGGFSVAHRLREQAPEVPVVFITASKQQGLREMAANLGAAGFIEKPYEPEELLAVVAKGLKTNPDPPADAAELRRRAEDRLQTRERNPQSAIPNPQSAQQLVHELQVHQIELEMQNEELVQARAKADTLLAQYTDLYEFAPTGYFNLAADGTILAVNLTGAGLLGLGRAELLNRRLGLLVSEADRPVFNAFLEKAFAGGNRECCEVALLRAETEPLFVRIEAVVSAGRGECRAAVLDVTDRHRAEAERERLIQELTESALTQRKKPRGEEAPAPAPPM